MKSKSKKPQYSVRKNSKTKSRRKYRVKRIKSKGGSKISIDDNEITQFCLESISNTKLKKCEDDDSGYYIIAGELFPKKQVHDFLKKMNLKKRNVLKKTLEDMKELPSKSKFIFNKTESGELPNSSRFLKYKKSVEKELPNKSRLLYDYDYELPSKSEFFYEDEDQYYNFELPNTSKKIDFK